MDELERIAAAFPDLTWSRARRITEGWDHVVVLDDALVFRFPQEPPYADALGREVTVLDHLAPLLPVRIPRYDRVAPDGSFAGYPLLPGRTLVPEVLASLDGTALKAVVDQLAGFLSALHTAPAPGTPLERMPRSYLAEDQRGIRQGVEAICGPHWPRRSSTRWNGSWPTSTRCWPPASPRWSSTTTSTAGTCSGTTPRAAWA